MAAPWETTEVVLERGGPFEILPDQRPKLRAAAERYIREAHPAEAKERVAAVWIAGETRPPWFKYTKMPDLRSQLPEQYQKQPEPSTELG